MKNHNLSLFARMGGCFDKCYFILEIYGDNLDPEHVSSVLGRLPTKAYRKGDVSPRGAQYRRTGAWIIDSGKISLTDDNDGEHLFEDWLATLPDNTAAWKCLRESLLVPRVRLVMYTDQMNSEFMLSPIAAQELARRGLSMLVDPYLSLDEDEP
jgi:Domain of unknown function (DUF4279)